MAGISGGSVDRIDTRPWKLVEREKRETQKLNRKKHTVGVLCAIPYFLLVGLALWLTNTALGPLSGFLAITPVWCLAIWYFWAEYLAVPLRSGDPRVLGALWVLVPAALLVQLYVWPWITLISAGLAFATAGSLKATSFSGRTG